MFSHKKIWGVKLSQICPFPHGPPQESVGIRRGHTSGNKWGCYVCWTCRRKEPDWAEKWSQQESGKSCSSSNVHFNWMQEWVRPYRFSCINTYKSRFGLTLLWISFMWPESFHISTQSETLIQVSTCFISSFYFLSLLGSTLIHRVVGPIGLIPAVIAQTAL